MKAVAYLLAFLLVASALAMTPAQRLNRLRACTYVIVLPSGKAEQFTVYGQKEVRKCTNLFKVDAHKASEKVAGREAYMLKFFRGSDNKPMDMIWIAGDGTWGFAGDRSPYGRDPKVIDWIAASKGK